MIAPGYTALSLLSEPLREGETYDAYILMKNPRKNLDAFAEKLSGAYTEASYQTSLLTMDGYSVFNNYSNMLVSLAAVFCVLIFIGSVSLIYSAFSISVSERTKQFGLLASIGATRSQIRRSVLFEAFALCICGIPIGLFVGIGGMGITLLLCGDLFKSVLDAPFGMSFSVSWQAVAVAVAVAVLTVFVSAWIPSRRAMKISPIEAIRQEECALFKAFHSAFRCRRHACKKILCTQPQKVSRNDSCSCNEPCAFHLCKRFLHVSHKVGRGRIHGKKLRYMLS